MLRTSDLFLAVFRIKFKLIYNLARPFKYGPNFPSFLISFAFKHDTFTPLTERENPWFYTSMHFIPFFLFFYASLLLSETFSYSP